MKPTVKDVAVRAGVSPITVSRVINGSDLVSEKTRKAVLEAIAEMDYKPNLLARSLVHGSAAPLVGFVATELVNPFYAPIISAVQAVARLRDHLVVTADSEREPAYEATYLRLFERLRIGGVVITPLTPETAPLEAVRDAGIPVVVVARSWANGDYVTADNALGGRIVADHLLGLGHRRIALVALDEPGHTAAADRLSGFRSRLLAAGVGESDTPTILTRSLSTSEGSSAAGAFLALSPRPTAAFVVADRLAIGFVHELLSRGIDVPGDVAVVGYDDIHYSAFLEVPLTTVALPKLEIGRLAAEILFDRMTSAGSEGPWRQMLLPPRLVVRASSGAGARDQTPIAAPSAEAAR